MSCLVFTPTARRNIRGIWAYIARDSIRHADLVEEAIFKTCFLLASVPEMGHRRPELSERNILFFTVPEYSNYCIAYVGDSEPLRILRVFHGAQDIRRLFRR